MVYTSGTSGDSDEMDFNDFNEFTVWTGKSVSVCSKIDNNVKAIKQ